MVELADAEGDAEKINEAIKTHLNPIPKFKLFVPVGKNTFAFLNDDKNVA